MKAGRALAAVCMAVLCSVPSLGKEEGWVEVRSPHFEVISNGSAKDARQVALGFEQMRTIFGLVSKLRVDSGAQTIVVAPRDENTMKQLLPMFWKRRGQMHPAGLFHRGWERDYAVVRLDQEGYDYSTIYHEYIHKLLHLNFRRLPTWLDEGLAEFYGTAQVRKEKAILGMPSLRLQMLRQRPPYPFDKFLSAGPSSPYIRQEDKAGMFYAESWGLTHYLMFGKDMGQGARMDQYLGRLQHGDDPLAAFQQVFGDVKQVQAQFEDYIRKYRFLGIVLNHTIEAGEKDFTVRKMSPAETDAALGGFYLYFGEQDTAERLLRSALAAEPTLAAAHLNLAFLQFARGEDADAEQEFSKVLQSDPDNYIALYYHAMLANYRAGADFQQPQAVDAALQKVLQLNPNFAPALIEESRVCLQEHRNAEALKAALRGQHLEPDRAGYALNVARIILLLGDKPQAAEIAAYVARRWWGPDRAEALDLLASAEAPGSKPDVPGLDYAENTQAVTGTIESVTCAKPGDGANETQLVLRTADGSLNFQSKAFGAGFSDTLWYGTDHFNVCHHLSGLTAVVRYKPGPDPHSPAEFTWLEVRDNPNISISSAAQKMSVVEK